MKAKDITASILNAKHRKGYSIQRLHIFRPVILLVILLLSLSTGTFGAKALLLNEESEAIHFKQVWKECPMNLKLPPAQTVHVAE